MDMPGIVQAYFEADMHGDADALVEAFAPDGVVHDEGAVHEGAGAIRNWFVAAKSRYRQVAEPVEVIALRDVVRVCAKVSGSFPNSPVMLDFLFTIRDGKIAALQVK